VDTLTPEKRSALMKRVKRSGTTPEMIVRRALHKKGFRYIVADKRLPGTPDLAFPKFQTVIFVHGCFWHAHSCRQGRAPSSNVSFWSAKIQANKSRDARKEQALRDLGWKVITVWECELKLMNVNQTIEDLAFKIADNSNYA
jgi:DNA mismatch endonuclease (patch repair protein)